jgi:hypothetical protein
MKKILRIGALSVLLFPALALAAPKTFSELAELLVNLISGATLVLITFGLVMYIWGMAVNIPEFGDEKGAEKRKSFFFWGIIILFVMISIWGILQLLQNTLFGDSSGESPSSGPSQQQSPFDEVIET